MVLDVLHEDAATLLLADVGVELAERGEPRFAGFGRVDIELGKVAERASDDVAEGGDLGVGAVDYVVREREKFL